MSKILSADNVVDILRKKSYPQQKGYFLMYSSWLGGFVQDPGLMVVPVDDHQVHRGDAVFEAIKVVNKKAYLLEPHLLRLESSAQSLAISLDSLGGLDGIRAIIAEALSIAGVSETMIRLFVSRGPGGFTTNPYESVGAQLYILITKLSLIDESKYQNGVSTGRSQIPPKESWMATVKSCNYLPNVMMKKEAIDRGLDFTVSFDSQGALTESSTENMLVLTRQGDLLRPRGHQILKGTMMTRVLELARQWQMTTEGANSIRTIGEADISELMMLESQELMMVGTTLDVLPVASYQGISHSANYQESSFKVARVLRKFLQDEMNTASKKAKELPLFSASSF